MLIFSGTGISPVIGGASVLASRITDIVFKMKPRISNQRNRALTFAELLVVIAILVVLVALLLPVLAATRRHPSRINCVSNLKQVNLSFRIWEGDHDNKYPMEISVTNGGAMEATAMGDVVNCYRVMSNELSTPKILICPIEADLGKAAATNFTEDLNNSHISYFVSADVTNENFPQRVLSGDDNFLINGVSIKSGFVQYPTHTSIAWGPDRHQFVGNLGYVACCVSEVGERFLRHNVDSHLQL